MTKKEDIEGLLAAITGTNNSNRRLENQRVSLAELQEKQQHHINQSQSDSNLQKIQHKKPKKEKVRVQNLTIRKRILTFSISEERKIRR